VTSTWTASSSGQVALSAAVVAPSGTTTVVAPAITTQPASQTATAGSSVTFSVAASGTAPLTYQWNVGGTAISGATSSLLRLTNVQSANAGSYTVTVTNPAGSVTSSAATLTVSTTATAPTLTTQPVSQTVTAGNSVTFTAVASGTAPLAYQWKFGGVAIPGATSASLTITNVKSANAGSYAVTVTNSVGSVTSGAATLTVNAVVTSGSAPVITTQPVSQSVADGASVTLGVAAAGSALTYQWQKNGVNLSGAVSSTLTLGGVHAANAGAYTVIVSNASGSDVSDVATLVTQPVIPARNFNVTTYGAIGDGTTINTTAIQNAINAAVAAGGGTVEVPAGSKAYMSDHLTLGSNIRLQVDSGATLRMLPPATYANAAVNFITAGDSSSGLTAHDVEITGPGTIDGNGSTWWSLSTRPKMIHIDLTTTAQVKNITLLNSSKMHLMTLGTNNVTISGVTISAPSTSPNTDGIDPSGNDYIIQNCNVSVGDDDIVLKAETQSCADILVNNCTIGTGHGVSIGAQTNVGVNGYRVTNCSFSGTDYVIRLKAQRGEGGLVTNVLFDHITFTGINKAPIYISSYYDSLPSNPASDAGQAITSTSLTPQWQNIIIRNMSGSTVSSPSKGIGDIYGVPEAPIGPVLFDNVTVSGTTKTLTINHARDVQFVNNCSVALNTGTSTSLYDVGPIITTEPASQSVTAGTSVTFGVVSLSATAQTYQWLRNGTAISGATGSRYVISSAQSANAGSYSVVVTNSVKSGIASTTSDDAILTVN
jgi:polygalacturonase